MGKFATREQARQAVMDWMAFYNHRRLHSSLGYLSPMQYEQRWYEAQRKGRVNRTESIPEVRVWQGRSSRANVARYEFINVAFERRSH